MNKPLSTCATMQAIREDLLGAWEPSSGILDTEV